MNVRGEIAEDANHATDRGLGHDPGHDARGPWSPPGAAASPRPALRLAARRLQAARDAAGRRLPALWLFSDPVRLPDPCAAAARLPRGAAVVARALAPAVLARLALLARRRGLRLLVAGAPRLALGVPGAGLHLPDRAPPPGLPAFLAARRAGGGQRLLSVAAHGRAGLWRARRLGADAALLSPVFPTRSHPGAPALGVLRWAALAARAGVPVVALGGVDGVSARRLPRRTAGLAAIGALRA